MLGLSENLLLVNHKCFNLVDLPRRLHALYGYNGLSTLATQLPETATLLPFSLLLSYHIVDLKRQNRLKVGTNKPKLKVNMQSVSDDVVRKRLLEQPRFELAAKGVFRLGRCDIFWQGVPGLRAPATGKARLPTVDRLTGGTRRRLVPVERSDCLPGRLCTGTSGPRYGDALP